MRYWGYFSGSSWNSPFLYIEIEPLEMTVSELLNFITQFSECSLPKAAWTHEAHLIVAIWHNWHFPYEEAFEQVKAKIIAYNEAVGTANTDTSGYHETLTRFWMILSRNFLSKNSFSGVEEACTAFTQSEYADKAIPLAYYSRERLFSAQARHQWVQGDQQALQLLERETK